MSIAELLDYLKLDFPDCFALGLVAKDIATATELFSHDIERLRDEGILPQRHCRRIARYVLRNGRQFPPLPLVSESEEGDIAWQAEKRTRSPVQKLRPTIENDNRIEAVLKENEQLRGDMRKLQEVVMNIEKQLIVQGRAPEDRLPAMGGYSNAQNSDSYLAYRASPPAADASMQSPSRPKTLSREPREEVHTTRSPIRSHRAHQAPHFEGYALGRKDPGPHEGRYEGARHDTHDYDREMRRRVNSGRLRMMNEHIAVQQKEIADKTNRLREIEERHYHDRESRMKVPHQKMWDDRQDDRAMSAMTRIEERARASLPSSVEAVKAMEERLAARRGEVDAARQRLLQSRQQSSDTVDRRNHPL